MRPFRKTPLLLCLAFIPVLSAASDQSLSLNLRGKMLSLARLQPSHAVSDSAVIFLPGDGGWRGVAISMAKMIASWGYDVYGFDTKRYLEAFSEDGAKLSQDQMAIDMKVLSERVNSAAKKPVLLVGWSQGAGMAVLAASRSPSQALIRGVLTLGLPRSAVLGWDWKATVATVARREPDQPAFSVKPLLANMSPTPICMIYGSQDEYTNPENARDLFEAASEPKRLQQVTGANHRFDGHQDELYRLLKQGLEWIAGA
jgi:type IV secretory pathway VirJ component